MKSIEKLEISYERELELAERHKQNAADIKKEMELLKGSMINQKTKALNLNGAEYDQFVKFLESKQNVLDAIELVLGKEAVQKSEEVLQESELRIADEKGDDEDVYKNMER